MDIRSTDTRLDYMLKSGPQDGLLDSGIQVWDQDVGLGHRWRSGSLDGCLAIGGPSWARDGGLGYGQDLESWNVHLDYCRYVHPNK